jgi:hypothetical protein
MEMIEHGKFEMGATPKRLDKTAAANPAVGG